MAIRDVGGNKSPVGGGAAGALPATIEKGLNQAGLLEGGKAPKDAAQALINALNRAIAHIGQGQEVYSNP